MLLLTLYLLASVLSGYALLHTTSKSGSGDALLLFLFLLARQLTGIYVQNCKCSLEMLFLTCSLLLLRRSLQTSKSLLLKLPVVFPVSYVLLSFADACMVFPQVAALARLAWSAALQEWARLHSEL
tara:strand:+ start:178 stop:555 length:378 start_codon:yes stop_codon:yes gene_type:complete